MTEVRRRQILAVVRFVALATVGFAPASAVAQRLSGVTVTPGNELALIQKDVGAERWAISVNRQTGLVTGNVFYSDGREPTFLYCLRTSQSDAEWAFDCAVTGPCASAGCAASWTNVGRVALDASFFATPDDGGGGGASQCAVGPLECVVIEQAENFIGPFGCSLRVRIRNPTGNNVSVAIRYNAFDGAGSGIGFTPIAGLLTPNSTKTFEQVWPTVECDQIASCAPAGGGLSLVGNCP